MNTFTQQQLEDMAVELVYEAAMKSGFYTDGENFTMHEEGLIELKNQYGSYDFTDILYDFAFSLIEKMLEIEALKNHQGEKQ